MGSKEVFPTKIEPLSLFQGLERGENKKSGKEKKNGTLKKSKRHDTISGPESIGIVRPTKDDEYSYMNAYKTVSIMIISGLVTNSILFCLLFTIEDRCRESAFSTNAQSRFASVVVDGVLGPLRLARDT